jgi:hypothetical protein
MAAGDGITVSEFVDLMKTHTQKSYGGGKLSYADAQGYLDQCVESGLLTQHVDYYGRRRYVPTARLVQTLGALQ